MLSPSLQALLKQVSRSFYLSVSVLPATVQSQVGLAYLLARAADSIADTPVLAAADRRSQLVCLRQALVGDDAARHALLSFLAAQPRLTTLGLHTESEQRLLLRLGDCLTLYQQLADADRQLVAQVLQRLTQGMERDLIRFPSSDAAVPAEQVISLPAWTDLDDYVYFAAGCVGEFWTDLTAAHVPAVHHLATDQTLRRAGIGLGNALQLVNVLRDVREDLRAGRCYWPDALLHPAGLTATRLAQLAHGAVPTLAEAEAVRRVTRELIVRALHLCEAARAYVRAIPPTQPRLRLACVWPLWLAVQTLETLHAAGSPLLLPPTAPPLKVPRSAVYRMLAWSTSAALFDRVLSQGRLLDRMFPTPRV